MVLLNGFNKKTHTTPMQDLEVALQRKKGEGA